MIRPAPASRFGGVDRLKDMHETTYISPLGPLRLRADDDALLELTFGTAARDDDSPVLAATRAQLDEYFAGTRRTFDLPLRLEGSPWEQRVWAELRAIPYGETTSYGAIATTLGAPGSARAVGAANGRNPISIIVPCHRVIGASGALTGYAWGVENKSALLDLERGVLPLVA
jgi:methylated-DNA-[protein]-cysteine S-methyltransferase